MMNRPKFPVELDPNDPKRPAQRFWGPVGGVDTCLPPPQLQGVELPHPLHCPICGYPESEGVAIVYGWPLYVCRDCGVGYVWPQPSEDLLSDYYAQFWNHYLGDSSFVYHRSDLTDKIYRREAQYTARLLNGNRAARLLDVGAGDGTFLRCMQDLGFERIQGLDRDENNCRRAREGLGVDIMHGDFLEYTDGGWDAICLWATIEHLKDPLAYVCQAYRLLNQGGRFIVMTGDNSALPARLLGLFDMWVYPPEHLFYFSRRSLIRALRLGGFDAVTCQVGFQHPLKETVLATMRFTHSLRTQWRGRSGRGFRANASNLLTCAGRRL